MMENDDPTQMLKKKLVTKAAMAKKILKKKDVSNKKIVFDEDGQVNITVDYRNETSN